MIPAENTWKIVAEESKKYLEAQIEQSKYTSQVEVGDLDYDNPEFEVKYLENTETEEEFYNRLGELRTVKGGFDFNVASVNFDGWIGKYFGEMTAELNVRGTNEEDVELYWNLDTGVADLEREKTKKAVAEIEDTMETVKTSVDRNTDKRTLDYNWSFANSSLESAKAQY